MSRKNNDSTRMHRMDEPYTHKGGMASSDMLIFAICMLIILTSCCGLTAVILGGAL